MKDLILKEIDKYIKNCKRALEEPNPFGSVGAAMQASGALKAFEDLKKFVEQLH